MYRNLLAEMSRFGVSKQDVKEVWNCSDKTVDNKLNGVTGIDFDEAVSLRNKFFSGFRLEYLYCKAE